MEDYKGDLDQRLAKSAIVVSRLPSVIAEPSGVAGPSDLIALSAPDLMEDSASLQGCGAA